MKNILISLTLFLAAVTGARGTGVLEAMQAGDISLSGIASSSYSEAKLTVRNTRSYSVDIDFTTACFVQNNTSQRIGLSYEKNTGAYYPKNGNGSQRAWMPCRVAARVIKGMFVTGG